MHQMVDFVRLILVRVVVIVNNDFIQPLKTDSCSVVSVVMDFKA